MINVITIFGIALKKNMKITNTVTSFLPVEFISFLIKVISLYDVIAVSRMIHAVEENVGSFTKKKNQLT